MRLGFAGMALGLLFVHGIGYGQITTEISVAMDSAAAIVAPPLFGSSDTLEARLRVVLPGLPDSTAPTTTPDSTVRPVPADSIAANPDLMTSDSLNLSIDTAWKDSTRGYRRLGTVVVRGKARGKALARQERKNADNRKDVISIEAIQEHPDPDVADALSRAPGVTVQRSQGEGHYVQIRGSEPRLSTVTINGQKMTSSSGDTRAVDLGVIPVDQLSSIEVTKVLMPEMDGDAIGGTVNLVTPGAQDTQLVLKALLAGGVNDLPGKPLWQGSVALSRRFLDNGALGVYIGGSWFKNTSRTDDLEMEWDTVQGNRDVIWNLELRKYQNEKERLGASGRLDWRTVGGSQAYMTANWSRTDNFQLRDRFRITREGTQQIDPSVPDSFAGDGIKYIRAVREQERLATVSQATLGGSTRTGPVILDLSATGSSSSTHQDPNLLATFAPNHQLNSYIDPSDPDIPRFNAFYWRNPKAIDPRSGQASEYGLTGVQSVRRDAQEDDFHGRIDAKLALGADSAWQLRVGGKWGWNQKDQEVSGGSMNTPTGTSPLNLSQVLSSDSGVGFYNGNYTMGPLPDVNAIKAWLAANGSKLDTSASSNDHIQNDPLNYTVVENHWAGYAQAKSRDGDLSVLGGLRLERYDLRSTGYVILTQADESWVASVPVTVDRTFDFLLPMVSARWSPISQLVARASFTRSFSLPDAMDLLPTTQVDLLDLTDKVGNPDLKATVANAVELDLEWYRKPRGMASIGLFGKTLEDYVFPVVWEAWDNIRKASFTYFSKANGRIAYLAGIELEAQQPLNFLPSFLSGFGLEGNYTYTYSTTTLPGRSSESTLPGQADQSGNLGLRYDLHGFSCVLSGSVQSPFLYQVAGSRENDTWVDWHRRVDASISQRFGRGILVYLQAANLTDAPYRLYMGDTHHPTQIEYSGRTYEGGVRISL